MANLASLLEKLLWHCIELCLECQIEIEFFLHVLLFFTVGGLTGKRAVWLFLRIGPLVETRCWGLWHAAFRLPHLLLRKVDRL